MDIADFWFWLSAGLILMVLEIVTPGIFFLWIGIGAFITGIIAMVFQGSDPAIFGGIFAILSFISVLAGKKVMENPKNEKDNGLNNRTANYIGQVYQAKEDFVNGRGQILIADSLWQASCNEKVLEKDSVKVIGASGVILEVSPFKEPS